MFSHLTRPDAALFFSRNDSDDPRLGDLARRDPDEFPGNARVVLVGVPQDIGVRRNGGRPGAAGAPDAIRTMLYRLTPYDAETGGSIPDGFLFDAGDIYCYDDLEDIHARLEDVVRHICGMGLIPLVLGGGHDVTYAAASGVHASRGVLGLINVDAHLDVRPPVPQRNSGTSFRALIEAGKIEPQRFIEFGIQPFANAARHVEWLKSRKGTIRTLESIRGNGLDNELATALRTVARESGPFYATLDIDGVRSADAPGVSASLPDGFTAGELLAIARALGRDPNCVALDIAEVNPLFDIDSRTAKLAAHAAVRFIAGKAEEEVRRQK